MKGNQIADHDPNYAPCPNFVETKKCTPSESICNPLSFSFFSFQFFLRQYAFEVHGAAQSYPTIYQKLGLEFWIEKKGHNAG